VAAEAGDLAAEMSTRVDVVADELKARLQRMGDRPVRGEEGAYAKARREALAAAQGEELRLLLRAILSGTERRQGAIPFALDRERRLYAPEPADETILEGLGLRPGKAATRRDAGDWVVAERNDPETAIVIGVARPVGPALQEMRRTAANNLALGLVSPLSLSSASCPLAPHDAPPLLAHRGGGASRRRRPRGAGAGSARPRVPPPRRDVQPPRP